MLCGSLLHQSSRLLSETPDVSEPFLMKNEELRMKNQLRDYTAWQFFIHNSSFFIKKLRMADVLHNIV